MFETTNQLCKITPHHTSFSRHRHATAKVCVSLSTAFVKSHLAAVKTNRPKKPSWFVAWICRPNKNMDYQWIGLRENLQETIDFPIFIWGFPVNFPLNQSIESNIFALYFPQSWWMSRRKLKKKSTNKAMTWVSHGPP